MNFHSLNDKRFFLLDINRPDLLDEVNEAWSPSSDLMELFIKGRQQLIPKLKDFRRSQSTKAAWRHHRPGFLKGIRSFHKSTAGKRFHRTLGRWLSTRIPKGDLVDGSILSLRGESLDQRVDLLRAVNSVKNYAFAELGFYQGIFEELDYWEFLEEIFPLIESVEKKLFLGEDDLIEEEVDVLICLVEDDEVVAAVVETTGKSKDEVWNYLRKAREGGEERIGWGQGFLSSILLEDIK